MTPPVRRILLIKLRAIGDVLLSTAVIPGLRSAYPDASIDFLTEKYCAGVLEGNRDLSGVLLFDPASEGSLDLIRRIRGKRYDLVIDLFGNPRSAVLSLLSGAPIRVGYRFNWRALCYNRIVEPRGGEVHNVEFNLDALRRLEIPPGPGKPCFPLDAQAERFADDFYRSAGLPPGRVVAFNPGGGWISKKWRPGHFSELGRRLAADDGAAILVVWGPGEESEASDVQEAIGQSAVLAPPTSLKQLGSLLRRSAVLVTNDSGPMHIAAALGVPVVAMFGPTVPRLQGPVNTESVIATVATLDCLGCGYTVCPIGNPCMIDLSPGDVQAAYRELRKRTMSNPLTR